MEESDLPINIFNDRYFAQGTLPLGVANIGATTCDVFSRFPYLPKELRVMIWTWHLRHRRFLRVLLEEPAYRERNTTGISPRFDDSAEDYGEWGAVFSPAPENRDLGSAGHVRITFLDASMALVPALPLVCREARDAYKSFYRIRLPSLVRVPSGPDFEERQTVAHLHHDNDVLALEVAHPPQIVELLPSFLHAVLQHDYSPAFLRFGVRNLCLDLKKLGNENDDDDVPGGNNHSLGPASILSPDVLCSVRTNISNLRNLYLRLTTSHLEPRVTSGPLTGSRALPWYNASMPVLPPPVWKGFSSQVEPVEGSDTRLEAPEGAADLHQVWIGSQIGPSMEVWEELERLWGVGREEGSGVGPTAGRDLRVRALVALTPETGGSMEEFLRKEKAAWLSLMDATFDSDGLHRSLFEGAQRHFLVGPSYSSSPHAPISPYDWFLRRRQQTAAGYWLMDTAMLRGARTKGATGKKVADLSQQGGAAIELWIFRSYS